MAIERNFRKLAPTRQVGLRRVAVAMVKAGRTRIEAAAAVRLILPVVGRYLRAWGFTAKRPVRRAAERRDEAVREWLKNTSPALTRGRHKAAKSRGPKIQGPAEPGFPIGPDLLPAPPATLSRQGGACYMIPRICCGFRMCKTAG